MLQRQPFDWVTDMGRKYTGWDSNASGRRAGTEKLIQLIVAHTGKNLWNNGSWLVRNKRGKGSPSVHGTGRAFDLSWRNMGEHKGSGRYEHAVAVMDMLTDPALAEALEIEAVFDYYPQPFGRGWKCDRNSWTVYDKRAFSGSPGGDWIHVEISNRWADSPADVERIWNEYLAGDTPKPKAEKKPAKAEARPAPGKTYEAPPFVRDVKRGSRGDQVKLVQQRLADLGYKNSSNTKPIVVDGQAGKNTVRRIKDFQSDHPCPPVDGWVGRKTWAALFAD